MEKESCVIVNCRRYFNCLKVKYKNLRGVCFFYLYGISYGEIIFLVFYG